jgi:hypothetical protein
MKLKHLLMGVAAAVACAGAAWADTINFDTINMINNKTTGTTTGGVGFTVSGPGAGFSVRTEDATWAGNFPEGTTVLYDGAVPGPITINFNTPITSLTDLGVEASLFDVFTATVQAYDGSTLVDDQSQTGISTYLPGLTDYGVGSALAFDLSAAAITSIVISSTNDGDGIGIGGVNSNGGGQSSVPEPAAWAMLLLGFFGVGAAARMGRRKAYMA